MPVTRTPAAPSRADRLNLLFITVDDMNWSLPGFMGGRQGLTPHLDALAERSHRFVNNRCAASICQPSRQAMMSGLKPHHSGGSGFVPIREGLPTLASLLHDNGYFTSAIHKIEHMQPASCFPWDLPIPGSDRNPEVYDAGVRQAIQAAGEAGKPFFINCNLNDPHRPFYGSAQAAAMDNDQQGPYRIPHEVTPEEVTVPPHLEDLPDVRRELAQYWNSTQRLDITVGRVLRALDDSGLRDDTIVLFIADHGMPFPFAKATCWDNGTRTPFLLSWPGMGRPTAFEDPTSNVDLLPTLLDIVGIAPPAIRDGHSLLPRMQGRAGATRRHVVTEVNTTVTGVAYPSRAIQDTRYALVFSPWSDGRLELKVDGMAGLTYKAMVAAAANDPQLARRVNDYVRGVPVGFYDLERDPGQRVNLIGDPAHRERIDAMSRALLAEMQQTNDPQLDNIQALIEGRTPVVPQDPDRWRSALGDGGIAASL